MPVGQTGLAGTIHSVCITDEGFKLSCYKTRYAKNILSRNDVLRYKDENKFCRKCFKKRRLNTNSDSVPSRRNDAANKA